MKRIDINRRTPFEKRLASVAMLLLIFAVAAIIIGIPIWLHFLKIVREYWGF